MSKIDGLIARIRKQPEHIRMRWVWICVAISMALIFFIWVLSLKVSLREDVLRSEGGLSDISETFSETFNKPDEPSLADIIKDGKETIDETRAATQALEGEDEIGNSLDSILGTSNDREVVDQEAQENEPLQ